MAKRSRQFGSPTLGVRPATASEENDATAQRALDYNKAAAAQYAQQRQTQLGVVGGSLRDQMTQGETEPSAVDSQNQAQGTEAARVALAKALGHDPNNAPPLSSMMARFYSLPANVQAGIYKQGGAQFIDGKTGMKMLQSVAEDREKALDAHTNELGTHLASGKINYDVSADGKPSFYSMEKDPSDLTGMTQKKVPLNTLQLALLDRGFKKGIIPNPFNPDQANGALPTPPKQMSPEDFQKVLDARAAGEANGGALPPASSPSIQYPTGTDSSANASNMSLSPYKYGSNMQLGAPYEYGNNLQFQQPAPVVAQPAATPSNDFFVNAGNATRALPGRIGKALEISNPEDKGQTLSNVIDAAGATAAAFPNTILRGFNASRRFFGGEGGGAYGQTPLIPVDAQAPAEDPAVAARRNALQAAMLLEQRQKDWQPGSDGGSANDWGVGVN